MSLFGSIQLGANTLGAMQVGLQVVGNNIANANTPGYVRQEAVFVPAPVQKKGELILGLGVEVDSIIQKIDRFVQERLVGARGDRANAEVQEQVYRELEVRLNELSDSVDLSEALTSFFNSIDEVMKDPTSPATRNLAVNEAGELTLNFNNLQRRVSDLHKELDARVTAIGDEVNNLSEVIRQLNIKIASTEGGDTSGSKAGGLRDRRQAAVDRLSELVGVHIVEQPSGGLAITVGGEFLVFEGQRREVTVNTIDRGSFSVASVEFKHTGAPLSTPAGELNGLYTARDAVVGDFLTKLDQVAHTLAFEFNKLYSQGQGLVGFRQLRSVNSVDDPAAPLDAAGLPFTRQAVILTSSSRTRTTRSSRKPAQSLLISTGLMTTHRSSTWPGQLDAIDGLAASISSTGSLQISTDSKDSEFTFAGDTSGVLAALGLNVLFVGSNAATLGVNTELKGVSNAGKFAASLGGVGNDSANAERLAAFLDRPLESTGNASLADLYNELLNEVTQGSSIAQSVAEGYRVFELSLEGQAQAVSGVSIDEEAVKMITLQRIYQASARFIQTVSELLDLLVNL